MNLNPLAAEEQFLNPLDRVNGFDIRPGLYESTERLPSEAASTLQFILRMRFPVSCCCFTEGKKSLTGRSLFRKITGSGGYIR